MYVYTKQYQRQVQLDGNVVSYTVDKSLAKAFWILCNVITKHPKLNLLMALIQYYTQALTEVRQ